MLKYFTNRLSIFDPLCQVNIIEINTSIMTNDTQPPSANLVKLANRKVISIQILNDSIFYRDSISITDPNAADKILNHSFTTKSEGSGLGLYFIKEALEQFNGKLDITLIENNLVFKIILNNFQKVTILK
jgi:nitrogen-specific signal transduction histidine kinase